MNKRKVYNMASKKECKHSGPLVLQQAQYRAGVAEHVLEDGHVRELYILCFVVK